MLFAWNKGGTTEARPFVLYCEDGRFFLLPRDGLPFDEDVQRFQNETRDRHKDGAAVAP